METGNFRFYEPRYFGLNTKNPTNGTSRIAVQLESPTCLEMLVVGGWKFVAQREGTWFRANNLEDGSLELYARDDCGNHVYGVTIAPRRSPIVVREPVYRSQPPVVYREPIREIAPPPPPVIDSPYYETVSAWGVTASAMIGEFNSIPIGSAISSLTGRTVCSTKGRTFDIGVAHGGPESSLWRLTVMSKAFKEGSFTQYTCANCSQDIRTTANAGVHAWGVNLERVFRISVHEGRAIQPMVSVNGGVGRISGTARQQTIRDSVVTSTRAVEASELFSSKWLPNAGVGVGFMGDLGEHVTYAVIVAGVEYPGLYYGKIGLTFWF